MLALPLPLACSHPARLQADLRRCFVQGLPSLHNFQGPWPPPETKRGMHVTNTVLEEQTGLLAHSNRREQPPDSQSMLAPWRPPSYLKLVTGIK
jgi:hypothetical protein